MKNLELTLTSLATFARCVLRTGQYRVAVNNGSQLAAPTTDLQDVLSHCQDSHEATLLIMSKTGDGVFGAVYFVEGRNVVDWSSNDITDAFLARTASVLLGVTA